jgi:hypothetical protein
MNLRSENGLQPIYIEAGWSPYDGWRFELNNRAVWQSSEGEWWFALRTRAGTYYGWSTYETLEEALNELKRNQAKEVLNGS